MSLYYPLDVAAGRRGVQGYRTVVAPCEAVQHTQLREPAASVTKKGRRGTNHSRVPGRSTTNVASLHRLSVSEVSRAGEWVHIQGEIEMTMYSVAAAVNSLRYFTIETREGVILVLESTKCEVKRAPQDTALVYGYFGQNTHRDAGSSCCVC